VLCQVINSQVVFDYLTLKMKVLWSLKCW
jgi:hypothetical protein